MSSGQTQAFCFLIGKIIHLSIAIGGLLLLVGGTLVEHFGITNNILAGLGEALGLWFALLLIPGGILLFFTALLCWNEPRIVVPTLLFAAFLSALWFVDDFTRPISTAFILYAVFALYFLLIKKDTHNGGTDG